MATVEAGLSELQITADGELMQVLMLYPSGSPACEERLGPYIVDVARDGDWLPGSHPLVVVSHGSGGAPGTHRGLARHLARKGFVVLLPEHPGNNRRDNSLADTPQILATRPRQISALLDWAAGAGGAGGHIDVSRVGLVGHSLGGYTGLALAGGRPMAFMDDAADRKPRDVAVTADPRIAALVLLAPATPWFLAPGALDGVQVPILLVTGGRDVQTPPFHARIVVDGVADGLVEHREVDGAGHYSFLAPFPAHMCVPGFAPAHDAPGFDRAAFHAALYPEVAAFLHRHVGNGVASG